MTRAGRQRRWVLEAVGYAHPEASALVARRYGARGLRMGAACPGPGVTVLARNPAGGWAATLRLGLDSPAGLLCETLYAAEVAALRRAAGEGLAEVTRLAIEADCSPGPLLRELVGVALARTGGAVTDLLIEVHPRHERFYTGYFDFTRIGGLRWCPRVDAPAVLLHRKVPARAEAALA